MRRAALILLLGVAGVAAIGILIFPTLPEQLQERAYLPKPFFYVDNRDDTLHRVCLTLFAANGTADDAPLCAETFTLEGGGSASSSVTTNRSGAYLYSVSVDGNPPHTLAERLDSREGVVILVQSGQDVKELVIHGDYQA